jgi:hypothetical protein
MRDLLAGFYGALKGCDGDLEKVFITGVGRMVRTSVFSALNQLTDLTLHRSAATLCGLTQEELERDLTAWIPALAAANDLTTEGAWAMLKQRYNGYRFTPATVAPSVYNPWAVLNCLSEQQFGNWWWSTGTPRMLVTMAEQMRLPGGDLEGLAATDLSLLFDLERPEAVPLLWQTGYLTITGGSQRSFTLGFPNAEVREAWFTLVIDRFASGPRRCDGYTTASLMLDALESGQRPAFERALTALFAAIPYDQQIPREAFYHAVFIAALQAVGGRLAAEVHTWTGRADAVLETRDIIYCIEFKLGDADSGMTQLLERRYHDAFAADPRKVVLLAAGGFEDRRIVCRWQDVERR